MKRVVVFICLFIFINLIVDEGSDIFYSYLFIYFY